ncbi:MAG: hypothetical protein ACFE95_16445 [Candidatus Hodarchaeota archaeon]
MTLVEPITHRRPMVEIGKKTGFGILVSLLIVFISSFITSAPLTNTNIGMGFFLTGGLFLLIGSLRDIFGSLIAQKIRKKNVNNYFKSEEASYLWGFGVPAEDVMAGGCLIILSILISVVF